MVAYLGPVSLRSLLPLLRQDDDLSDLAGARSAVIAVPEPARAFAVAGLAQVTGRHPIVVAVPTAADADRLAHDLAAFLGPDQVETFPAWETLPFERVSPGVETMGRRLRAMWHLSHRDDLGRLDRVPRVIVAPVRALLQRLGPHADELAPVVVRPGDAARPDRAGGPAGRAAATAANTRSSTAASSPFAARSSTSTRRLATCPCASICGATRWTG